ncbi:NeuD/PglB/VioB family sugar acetyltransferase [Halomonas litopenaei]|uniref:NeuD/PglB/VioB family sugar acetyltransferase n=1 Tax=Halomonas litopenaei TaxID=2109328 RepID=UPI003FA063A0
MKECFVIGGGGHARVLLHGLRGLGWQVVGYVAREPSSAMPVPWLGQDRGRLASLEGLPSTAFLGIGMVTSAPWRRALLEAFLAQGFDLPPLITHSAMVHDDVKLGDGSVILDGAVVVTGSRLGRGCLINTRAVVDHDCVLGDNVHVACGATLSGGVRLGADVMIGTGANLIQGVEVCAGAVIGAGATVVGNVTRPGVYLGTPARRRE